MNFANFLNRFLYPFRVSNSIRFNMSQYSVVFATERELEDGQSQNKNIKENGKTKLKKSY